MIEPKKFWWMIKKELISLKRHPARLVSILAFPIIMILLFGYGMGGEMTDLPIVVVSQSHGDLTDLTLDTIKSTETYHVVEVIDDLDEGKERVDNAEVKAAIILPSDYDDDSSHQKGRDGINLQFICNRYNCQDYSKSGWSPLYVRHLPCYYSHL